MVGWHHFFEQAPGVGDGWGGLACCGSWGLRVGDNWATVKQQQPVREGASLVAQLVKNPPALQETLVRSLV